MAYKKRLLLFRGERKTVGVRRGGGKLQRRFNGRKSSTSNMRTERKVEQERYKHLGGSSD